MLDPYLLQLSAPLMAELNHIIYLTIVSGTIPKVYRLYIVLFQTIPKVWKAAHLLPFHKGGDSCDRKKRKCSFLAKNVNP
jgi:hypothetical protein